MTSKEIEDFLVWVMANRDVSARRWTDEIEPELKRQLLALIQQARVEELERAEIGWEQQYDEFYVYVGNRIAELKGETKW